MENRVSIHEAVRNSRFARSIELIDIPVREGSMVLLRTKKIPEYAFAIWASAKHYTLSQLVLDGDLSNTEYSVVCACCYPELKEVILDACKAHSVNTLFMRHAHVWHGWAQCQVPSLMEGYLCWDYYSFAYGREVAKRELCFIGWPSQGLGDLRLWKCAQRRATRVHR